MSNRRQFTDADVSRILAENVSLKKQLADADRQWRGAATLAGNEAQERARREGAAARGAGVDVGALVEAADSVLGYYHRPGLTCRGGQESDIRPDPSCAACNAEQRMKAAADSVRRVIAPTPPSADGAAGDLDELERLATAATAGPWRAFTNRHTTCHGEPWGWISDGPDGRDRQIGVTTWTNDTKNGKHDARFIAVARTAVPALIAEVRRLRALSAPPPTAGDEVREALNEITREPIPPGASVLCDNLNHLVRGESAPAVEWQSAPGWPDAVALCAEHATGAKGETK